MRRSFLVAAVALATLAGTGAAVAASADQWYGHLTVSKLGTASITTSYGNNQVVYTGRQVTFVIADQTNPGGNYSLAATGTMVNTGDEITPAGVHTFTSFDFLAKAITLKDPAGKVVCRGGVLSWGGSALNGNDFGQFTLPAACTVFVGPQYFNTSWEAGGGTEPFVIAVNLAQN